MYVDALAALVPAEVLSLHALIFSITTDVKKDNGITTTTINAQDTLEWAFWGLIALAVLLYVVPRWLAGKLEQLDIVRALIPPLAFVTWTMLQRPTAFDAACSSLSVATRLVSALFLAVILGLVATSLAYKADEKRSGT